MDAVYTQLLKTLMAVILLLPVDGKYCWHIFHGHTQYFYCGLHQTCCGARCCDNIVAFYRLWYFWMCVLMLFVACSGGGFWLRRRRLGDDLRASFTATESDGRFVRNLMPSPHATVNSAPFFPSAGTPESLLPVQPPAYSDVTQSKPPSYESLFRDGLPGGDNPSFQTEQALSNQNSFQQDSDKSQTPTVQPAT